MLRSWRGTGRWTWQWIRLGGGMDGGRGGGGGGTSQRGTESEEKQDPRNGKKGREDMWVSSLVTWDRLIHIGKGMLNESGDCDSTTGTDCTLIKRSCIHFPSEATLAHTQTHTSIHVRNQCHILSLLSLKLVAKDFVPRKSCLQPRRWNVLLLYCDVTLYLGVCSWARCSQTALHVTLQWYNTPMLLFCATSRWITWTETDLLLSCYHSTAWTSSKNRVAIQTTAMQPMRLERMEY